MRHQDELNTPGLVPLVYDLTYILINQVDHPEKDVGLTFLDLQEAGTLQVTPKAPSYP